MDALIEKISKKDSTAVVLAKQLGASANAAIKPLAKNADPVVREIALECLDQAGGPGVAEAFAEALLDDSPTVRRAALTGLNNHGAASVYPRLLQTYPKVQDPLARQQIALVIGKSAGVQLADLQVLFRGEKSEQAAQGLAVAMAKIGDTKAQAWFAKALQSAKDRELKKFLDYVAYVRGNWALKLLGPVLADKSPLVRIGVDGLPGLVPEYLRACDLAVNLIVDNTGMKVSFPVDGKTNYTDAQLAEVRRALDSLT